MGCSSYVLGSFNIGRSEEDPEERDGVGRGEAESVVLPEALSSIWMGRTLEGIVYWLALGIIVRQWMGVCLSQHSSHLEEASCAPWYRETCHGGVVEFSCRVAEVRDDVHAALAWRKSPRFDCMRYQQARAFILAVFKMHLHGSV